MTKRIFLILISLIAAGNVLSQDQNDLSSFDAGSNAQQAAPQPPAQPSPPPVSTPSQPPVNTAPATVNQPSPTTTPAHEPTAVGDPAATPTKKQAATPAQAGLQPAGQVIWVTGTVKAFYPEQTPRVLARGAVIYEKDTVSTDTGATGEISFTDNTILSLKEKTTFVMKNYYFNPQKPKQGQFVMDVVKGGFRTITGFVAKSQPANYQVKTPVATIGVRGTDYFAQCSPKPIICNVRLLGGKGVTLTNQGGTVTITPQAPYGIVSSNTSAPVATATPPSDLGSPPNITPADTPPPSSPGGGGSGNCGLLIN